LAREKDMNSSDHEKEVDLMKSEHAKIMVELEEKLAK
jgi:hypothetical protein